MKLCSLFIYSFAFYTYEAPHWWLAMPTVGGAAAWWASRTNEHAIQAITCAVHGFLSSGHMNIYVL
jgi:hypothetical protein